MRFSSLRFHRPALRFHRPALRIPGRGRAGVLGWSPSSLLGRGATVTATAVVTCLVATVTSPQSAFAAPSEQLAPTSVAAAQVFTAGAAGVAVTDRDGFGVGTAAAGVVRAAGVASASGVVRPLDPGVGSIPDQGHFGSRSVRGCFACSTSHQGLDFAAPTGTDVRSVLPGTVVAAGWEGGYGQAVLVRHANGITTRYGHMSRIDVRIGQALAAGQQVGAVGSTGVSTGSHLHLEVLVGGSPVDPAPWLSARGAL